MHSEDENDDNTAPLQFAETALVGFAAAAAAFLLAAAVISTGDVSWTSSSKPQVAQSSP